MLMGQMEEPSLKAWPALIEDREQSSEGQLPNFKAVYIVHWKDWLKENLQIKIDWIISFCKILECFLGSAGLQGPTVIQMEFWWVQLLLGSIPSSMWRDDRCQCKRCEGHLTSPSFEKEPLMIVPCHAPFFFSYTRNVGNLTHSNVALITSKLKTHPSYP